MSPDLSVEAAALSDLQSFNFGFGPCIPFITRHILLRPGLEVWLNAEYKRVGELTLFFFLEEMVHKECLKGMIFWYSLTIQWCKHIMEFSERKQGPIQNNDRHS